MTLANAGVVHVGIVLILFCLSRDGASSVGELSSCIGLIWLVQGVGVTISCRFSSTACGCMISTLDLRVYLTIVIQVGDVTQGPHVLIIY